jgi:diacylglycerol kinase (ATP)
VSGRVQIVCNPGAGSFSRARIEQLSAAWANAGFTPTVSESSASSPYVPNLDAVHICIAGGDGTVRHVFARLELEANVPPVCIYPMGTINLAARELGMSREPDTFVKQVLSAMPQRFRSVTANDTIFMVCMSIGPDGRAVTSLSEPLKRVIGRLAYGVAMIGQLFAWPRVTVRVSANGKHFVGEALYIAKGHYFAGPWSFAPNASILDDLLHVVLLKTARRRDFLAFTWALFTGRIGDMRGVERFTCTELEWHADQSCPVQADGDIAFTSSTGKVSTKRAP